MKQGPAPIRAEVGRLLGDEVVGATAVGGGSINQAWSLELASGARAFLKSRTGAPRAEFEAEAAGLSWLAECTQIGVPRVLAVGLQAAWLALDWIEGGERCDDEALGTGLAALHGLGASLHGELPPGSPDDTLRIGSLELPSGRAKRWSSVYVDARILPLLKRARDQGAISAAQASAVERVCDRIDDLCGLEEPPARLHGDLWGGNVIGGAGGRPWLIDPAAHGGHREVDLAMLRLFGGPGPRAFAAYDDAHPLAEGHADRVELWQLLPLLSHAVLFGGDYGAAAGRAAARYA